MSNDVPPVDPASPVPIYFQLKELLLGEIEAGRLGPGDRLPTEHELCDRYGVSRTPASRALSELAAEGVIVRHRRRGSFVNPEWAPPERRRTGLSMLLPESPVVPAPSEAVSEVAVEVIPVPPDETNAQVQRLAAEGAAPDVALVDLGRLSRLVDSELVRPLDVDLVVAGPLLGPTATAAPYAIPVALSLTGLWVRRDAGPPPQSWDQLLDVARVARDTASLGSPIVVDAGGDAGVDAVLTAIASNRHPVDPVRFDDDPATEALRLFRTMVGEGLLSSDVVGAAPGDAAARIAGGDAVVMVGSSTDAVRLADAVDDLAFAPFPAGPLGRSTSLVSGWGMVVTRQSQRPELAMRTAAEIALQGDQASAAALGLVPVAAAGYGATADDETDFRRVLRLSRPRPWAAGHPVLAAQLERVLAAVITGRLRPPAAAASAQEVLEAVTAAAGS